MLNRRSFKDAARTPYAWPGGYPTYVLMADGEACCIKCARSEARIILQVIRINEHENTYPQFDPEWLPIAHEVNWEDDSLYCANCNARIESAYGENENV